MTDTRRAMTRAEFEAAAASDGYERWWLTGQDAFLHVSPVMQIEGWDVYGSSGFNRLTQAQRVLMMWSDLVGQTANGGFEQFAYNLRHALPLAGPLIEQLQWPDLWPRFEAALAEQRALLKAQQFQEQWFSWDPAQGMVARIRSEMIEELARANTRLNPFRRSAERKRLTALTNDELTKLHDEAVAAGKLRPAPGRSASSMEVEEADAPASRTFDDWFLSDETRQASRRYVGAYIRRNRDSLVRLTD